MQNLLDCCKSWGYKVSHLSLYFNPGGTKVDLGSLFFNPGPQVGKHCKKSWSAAKSFGNYIANPIKRSKWDWYLIKYIMKIIFCVHITCITAFKMGGKKFNLQNLLD